MQMPGPPPFATHSSSVEHFTHLLDSTLQIGLAGSDVHWELALHSTQTPERAQACVALERIAQACGEAAVHGAQRLATQNDLVGSVVQWASLSH